MDRLEAMRFELMTMAEKEAIRLWRIARRAEKHGVSKEVIHNIREEAHIMNTTMTAYPERILAYNFKDRYHYAFR